jgi:hypothetical protein
MAGQRAAHQVVHSRAPLASCAKDQRAHGVLVAGRPFICGAQKRRCWQLKGWFLCIEIVSVVPLSDGKTKAQRGLLPKVSQLVIAVLRSATKTHVFFSLKNIF